MSEKHKEYSIADKAWQFAIGCSSASPCAANCWARRTIARVVECQSGRRRGPFYDQALTPDHKHWSGRVLLDEAHLMDPLKWRKPALIAAGFHCDWGLLPERSKDRVGAVMGLCPQHTFMLLTKRPALIAEWATHVSGDWKTTTGQRCLARAEEIKGARLGSFLFPLPNAWIGCSVMTQADADSAREPMRQLAAAGWNTHAWHEPAIGPVDWRGWEFLKLLVQGGESGPASWPMHPQWARDTRGWCAANGVSYFLKQWGDWGPRSHGNYAINGREWGVVHIDGSWFPRATCWNGHDDDGSGEAQMTRVGKRAAGHLLDGQEWRQMPEVKRAL